jgi:glycosyltransferase involved in cell wall biosynthesis
MVLHAPPQYHHRKTSMSSKTSRDAMGSGVNVSCISRRSGSRPSWSLAVFAHNESGRIRAALESIVRAAGGRDVEVFVLANGCTDSTVDEVRTCANVLSDLWLAEIELGDKANAWNVYVHDLVTPERAQEIETYFFMDGDVTLEPDALVLLAAALSEVPSARAAGGMPATGRDKASWRDRMVKNGVLAGNLYALRGSFVECLRQRHIRLPVGLIGEDIFVSWLVATQHGQTTALDEGPRCIFCSVAEFSFRSLSPIRPADYRLYVRRKWRYTLRALQLEMLMHVLRGGGIAAMPGHVSELYLKAPLPSRLRWVGLDTPLRLCAVLWIRSFRRGPDSTISLK